MQGCMYPLRYDNGAVLTTTFIPNAACIGEMVGNQAYIWEMHHSEYIFIDDDLVLDVSAIIPRPILSLMKDDNQSDLAPNCTIQIKEHCDSAGRYKLSFWLLATRPIFPNEELVYDHRRTLG